MAKKPVCAEVQQDGKLVKIIFELIICQKCMEAFRVTVQEEIVAVSWRTISPTEFQISFQVRPNGITIARIGELLHEQLDTCYTQKHQA